MLTDLKRRVSLDILDNKIQYLLLVFFMVVGLTAGAFTVSDMQPGDKTALTGYIDMLILAIKTQSIDYFSVFIHAFSSKHSAFRADNGFFISDFGYSCYSCRSYNKRVLCRIFGRRFVH